eukprot:7254700-Prymnesium_polylepis.1
MASLIVFGHLGQIEVSEEKFSGVSHLLAVKTRSEENFRGFDSPILCQLLPLGLRAMRPRTPLLRPRVP